MYDLNANSGVNDWLWPWGIGMYHSGLEVHGKEWSFSGGSGVYHVDPKSDQVRLCIYELLPVHVACFRSLRRFLLKFCYDLLSFIIFFLAD